MPVLFDSWTDAMCYVVVLLPIVCVAGDYLKTKGWRL